MTRVIANKRSASITLVIALAAGVLLAIMATGMLSPKTAEAADPPVVPSSVIVAHNGLGWVWASPCADNGCSSIDIGLDGFEFATHDEWALKPPVSAFGGPFEGDLGKCASLYFDVRFNHCDWNDARIGVYGSAPAGGKPAGVDGNSPMNPRGGLGWYAVALQMAEIFTASSGTTRMLTV